MPKPMTNKEYSQIAKKQHPKSPVGKDMFNAFWTGGLICTLGQCIMSFAQRQGADQPTAGAITSVVLIFLGAFLTGINVYDRIAKIAGAGTIVPITGFSNSIVSPAMEYRSEGHILGIGAKMFVIAGPVLVFGIISSVAAGLILFLIGR